MIYRILADLVALAHFGFVLFVVLGGWLVVRRPKWALVHLPAVVWGVAIEWGGWICPLTPLENSLRSSAGVAGYRGGFIEHYLLPMLYPSGLTREAQIVLGCLALAVNLVFYGLAWRGGRRRMKARESLGTVGRGPTGAADEDGETDLATARDGRQKR